MKLVNTAVALAIVGAGTFASAQETGTHVRSIRVLATNPETLAVFYEKAFGMSETRRAANSPTLTEIVVNSGASAETAQKATSTPLVITTRPKDAPAGAMASLILQVPNLDKAIESVKANGGALIRGPSKSGESLTYAFVKDPDGNQIEMVMSN
jgi:predicted enzyme related to lactoylglutathione lyase